MNTFSIEQHVEAGGEGVKEKCVIITTVIVLAIVIYAIGAFHVFAYGNGLRSKRA